VSGGEVPAANRSAQHWSIELPRAFKPQPRPGARKAGAVARPGQFRTEPSRAETQVSGAESEDPDAQIHLRVELNTWEIEAYDAAQTIPFRGDNPWFTGAAEIPTFSREQHRPARSHISASGQSRQGSIVYRDQSFSTQPVLPIALTGDGCH
jgi:hypothetical protein